MTLPFVGGRGFDPKLLELAFGVILYIFASHITVGNSAAIVLPRDPSGRSLLWGAIAGLFAVIAVYCVWVLAVGGVIDADTLAAENGTALGPLASIVGRSVHMMGFGYVILTLGLGSVYYALGMVHLVRDQLGTRLPHPLRMGLAVLPPRGRSRLCGLSVLAARSPRPSLPVFFPSCCCG